MTRPNPHRSGTTNQGRRMTTLRTRVARLDRRIARLMLRVLSRPGGGGELQQPLQTLVAARHAARLDVVDLARHRGAVGATFGSLGLA